MSDNLDPAALAAQHLAAEAAHMKDLRKQKISSILIAVLIHVLLILALALWVIVSPGPEPEQIQVTVGNTPEFKAVTQKETQLSKRKPAPPSMSSKMITSTAVSEIFVPEVESTTFDAVGMSEDLGVGLGIGGFGGDGGGGGEAIFFGQKASVERVVFVVDYSLSMKGQRDKLMRSELTNTLKLLGNGVQYQVIFFAGPAWVAGGKVPPVQKGKEDWVVTNKGESYEWRNKGNVITDWHPRGKREKPEWIIKSDQSIKQTLEAVRSTPLLLGTAWEEPLEMALGMSPKPQIIFFMTDGATKNALEDAKRYGQRARRDRIPVNTIALMEPRAVDGMRELAERTGGKFTVVAGNGTTKEEDFGEKE